MFTVALFTKGEIIQVSTTGGTNPHVHCRMRRENVVYIHTTGYYTDFKKKEFLTKAATQETLRTLY